MNKKRVFVFILLSVLLCVLSFPTYAIDITINDSSPYVNNNGRCSLVEAIENANDDAATHADCPAGVGADTIFLSRTLNLNGSTLFPASNPVFFDSGDSGLPEITSDITISGGGLQRTGAIDFRFFVVQNTGSLTLNDMTLRNGSAVGECGFFSGSVLNGCGGAILVNNSNLTLTNVRFDDNHASELIGGDLPRGGAILMFGGTLTISESTFSNNTADYGGAIDGQNTTMSIMDSTFNANIAAVNGGAIRNSSFGDLTVIGSSFTANQATSGNAGAIDNQGSASQLTVVNSEFDGNTATNGEGGAIRNFNASTATISSSTFTSNSANSGGAITNRGSGATLNLFSSFITGNSAGFSGGGGISNGATSDTGIATINNSVIAENTTTNNGGGISTLGILTVENTIVDDNMANNGGGIYVGSLTGQSVTISGSDIINNVANSSNGGGGVHFSVDPSGIIPNQLTITDSTLDNNRGGRGGGLFGEDVEITVTRTTISNNTGTSANGGGVHVRSGTVTGAVFNMTNSTVSGNNVTGSGGGIHLNQEVDALINNSTIANNSASSSTGGDGINSNVLATRVIIQDSILDANGTINCFQFSSFGVTDGGNNISSDGTCGFADTGGVGIGDNIDPLLNNLADNGGNTQTHALQTGSPAIDNSSGGCPITDQRGAGRTNNCDIGAYEGTTSIAEVSIAVDETILYEISGTVATVTITLDNSAVDAQAITITVPLQVAGSASGVGFDYTQSNQNGLGGTPPAFVNPITMTALAGQIETATFTITAIDDALVENDESVNIVARLIGNASFVGGDSLSLTIISDDVEAIDGNNNAQDDENVDDDNVDEDQNPNIDVFDPAISKLGFLLPGELGVLGEKLRWDVTVSNRGSVAGSNVIVSDTLRPELQIDNVTTSKGTVDITGQTVTVTIPTLASGEQVNIAIFTTSLDGAIVSNTACVNADNQSDAECMSALPIQSLPNTGQTPWWRTILLLIVGVGTIACTVSMLILTRSR